MQTQFQLDWESAAPIALARTTDPATSHDGVLVPISRGLFTVVDEIDSEKVQAFRWHALPDGPRNYVGCKIGQQTVRLHRFILDAPRGVQVDHINGNPLDNRRANLRLSTRCGNSQNRGAPSGRRFKGTVLERGRWRSKITAEGVEHSLGVFDTEEDAARAYDIAACNLHGEFARLNFPDVPPTADDVANFDLSSARKRMGRGTSRFVGVSWNKNQQKWTAKIGVNGRRRFLGYFDSEIDAASAYNAAATSIHGDRARLNRTASAASRAARA